MKSWPWRRTSRPTRVGLDVALASYRLRLITDQETLEKLARLDKLYREVLRHSELEKEVLEKNDVVNHLAIVATMKSNDTPAPRNGQSQIT